MSRRRGSSLVAVMLLCSILGFYSLSLRDYGSQARQRVATLAGEVEAQAMARSGLRYAAAMVAHGRWRQDTDFHSPAFTSGARFHVTARRAGGGWELVSVGEVGARRHTLRERR